MTDTPEIIQQARAALIAHGLADNDGDDYVLDGVYATGAITVALEAVAPLIAAQALEDMADELHRLDDGRTGGYYEAGRHIIRRIRDRAAKLREAGR